MRNRYGLALHRHLCSRGEGSRPPSFLALSHLLCVPIVSCMESKGNHSVSLLRSFLRCCPEALVTIELDVGFIAAVVVLNRRSAASRSTCNPFSFGHPSVESVANRLFNNNTPPPNNNSHLLVEAHQKERISEIIQNYNGASRQSDAAKEKQKLLAQQASGRETNLWWEAPIEQLNLQEQEELDSRYTKHINELYDTISKKVAATTDAN
ncbi:hypothetical protein V6N13_014118 [Hibiscus sabdariffa]